MTQKTIVFDFGGVLFETSFSAFYRERFRQQGRSAEELNLFLTTVFPKKEVSRANGGTLQELIDRKVLEYPEWADEIRAYGLGGEPLKSIRGIVPGMEGTIAELAEKGYNIVGLTNWHGDTYDLLPEAFPSLLKHFNKVVVSGKVRLRKPDPEIFRRAHAEYGNLNPADVYYFDDKPANVEAAKKAVGWNAFVFKSADTVRSALALKPKGL